VVTRIRRGGSHEHQATVWLGGRLPWTARAGVTGGSHVSRAARSRSIAGRYLSASSFGTVVRDQPDPGPVATSSPRASAAAL